jgi:hypothetical protein
MSINQVLRNLLICSAILLLLSATAWSQSKPKVFVLTDINIAKGDPDDRQSMIHLLWYANELDIVGIVPDRWNAQGVEATEMALEAYKNDYLQFDFESKGYPEVEDLRSLIAQNEE